MTSTVFQEGLVRVYNLDCVEGARTHIEEGSVDLILTDPPYGIGGDRLHKHYHRKEEFVLDGYVEVPREEYFAFSRAWIREAERILRPGGSLYIVSGYTNLRDILNALVETRLKEINHIIWKYNFGVYTSRKYVSSHYHILYYVKPGENPTFNTHCRFGDDEKDAAGGSLNYQDREDVWVIPREYKPGAKKNKNELPLNLVQKILQYSSREGDVVCDLFLGGFSTARIALGMNRQALGFEINPTLFRHGVEALRMVAPGDLLPNLRRPTHNPPENQRKPWTPEERERLVEEYRALRGVCRTKRQTIDELSKIFGRGYFSILNVLAERGL